MNPQEKSLQQLIYAMIAFWLLGSFIWTSMMISMPQLRDWLMPAFSIHGIIGVLGAEWFRQWRSMKKSSSRKLTKEPD